MSDPLLTNYRQLLARVDELCGRIGARFTDQIACRKGCDACCRHLELFPVEGAALLTALQQLPASARAELRRAAADATPDGPCPLLLAGACRIYAARPVICRTHGLPLLVASPDGRRVDFCPLNFQGLERLPAEAVIDLERLNEALAAINRLYVRETGGDDAAAGLRQSIAALLAALDEAD